MKAASAKVDSNYAVYVEKKKKQMENGVTTPDDAAKKARDQIRTEIGQHAIQEHDYRQRTQIAVELPRRQVCMEASSKRPEIPSVSSDVVVIPANQKFIIDLGDGLPDTGNMRVRIRATRLEKESHHMPTVRLYFGHQPSNDSRISENVWRS